VVLLFSISEPNTRSSVALSTGKVWGESMAKYKQLFIAAKF